MPNGFIKVLLSGCFFETEMTQLPGTETSESQEAAAEASENVGSKGFSGRYSQHPQVLRTAENPPSMEKKASSVL